MLAEFLERLGVADPSTAAVGLLRNFGSISGLLSASWWRLCGSVGSRLAGIISASRDTINAALAEDVAGRPILASRLEVLQLLQKQLGKLHVERLIAVYIDTTVRLVSIEQISEGSRSITGFDVNRILHHTLDELIFDHLVIAGPDIRSVRTGALRS